MKTQDKQILSFLQAFDKKMVQKAFELFLNGLESIENDLIKEGWSPVDKKPIDIEYYFLYGKYWVQSDEIRHRHSPRTVAQSNKRQENIKKNKKTKMDLQRTLLKCPICAGRMYKQAICPGCKEGKAGHKIRLICEENPDHEVLL